MAIGNTEPIAPTSIIVPVTTTPQVISGALWISGATLHFMSADGADTDVDTTT